MKSKNEIKEKRGKIVFIIGILSCIILVVGYQWKDYLGQRLTDSLEGIVQEKTSLEKHELEENKFPDFMKARTRSAFMGAVTEEDEKIVNAIEFTAIDSLTIEYDFSSLVNWKNRQEVSGIAKLEIESVHKDKYQIEYIEGEMSAAYKFSGKNGACELELLISKRIPPVSSFSKIGGDCKNTHGHFSIKMYGK